MYTLGDEGCQTFLKFCKAESWFSLKISKESSSVRRRKIGDGQTISLISLEYIRRLKTPTFGIK
jgi:hypothetical protein